MFFKTFVLGLCLVVAYVDAGKTTPNPKSIPAMKSMLENSGFIQENDLKKCDASKCPSGYTICCEQFTVNDIIHTECCPSDYPKCVKKDGDWMCKAGAASFSFNMAMLSALAIFTTARANFF